MNTPNDAKFAFAELKLLDPSKVELVFNDRIEVSGAMIDQIFAWIEAKTMTGRGLLINKIHDYCYSFDAQVKLANAGIFSCVAIVRADGQAQSLTRMAIESLVKPEHAVEVRVFTGRDEALQWLVKKLGITFY